jgi:photosystem II stability/assembly factor-like uncharacterized protein
MDLSGSQQQQFYEALLSAFPTWDDLATMVSFHLDQNLAVFASQRNLQQATLDLITWAEARGIVGDLVKAALSSRPEDIKLQAFAQQIGFVTGSVAGQWRQCMGPYGGGVQAVTVDPHNSRVIYTGTAHPRGNNRVYKSIDAGQSWKAISNGLPGNPVYDIAVAYHDQRVLYVGTRRGLFKSTDQGSSWQLDERNAGLAVWSIVLSQQNPDLIAIGSYKPSGGGGTGVSFGAAAGMESSRKTITTKSSHPSAGGFHVSTNAGHIWATSRPRSVIRVVISAQDSSVIYLGSVEEGVFRSLDGGNTLTHVRSFDNEVVYSLAISPQNSHHVITGTDSGLYVSFDGGDSWKKSSEIQSLTVFDIIFSLHNRDQIHAATSAGVFESWNGGLSWQPVNKGLMPLRPLSLACSPDGTIYTGTDGGGVHRKGIDEILWQTASLGLYTLGGRALAVQSDTKVYFGTESCVFVSLNKGNTWRNIGPPQGGSVGSLATWQPAIQKQVHPQETGGLHISTDKGRSWQVPGAEELASTTLYMGTEQGIFYKTSDGGLSWQQLDQLTGWQLYSLAMVPQDEKVLYAGTPERGIFKSTDGGVFWRPISLGVADQGIVVIVATSDGRLLYCGTATGGVYKSTDGGDFWQAGGDKLGQPILSLAYCATIREIIYAGTQGIGVYKSEDGGSTWAEMNHGLHNLFVQTLLISPQNTQVLYAGTREGIYVSRDSGRSWEAYNDGLDKHQVVHQLAFSPSGRVLFAAMSTGVFTVDVA